MVRERGEGEREKGSKMRGPSGRQEDERRGARRRQDEDKKAARPVDSG